MAHAVPKTDYLALEESITRQTYWEQVVQGWLWRIPGTVRLEGEKIDALGQPEMPTPRSLQDYGWLKEPLSSLSH